MKIGYHAPLPPVRSGVADYAAALLGALRKHGDVVVNSAGTSVNLYHLGNNDLHRRIYSLALERPGVVVLHDAVLHHMLLGSFDETRYVAEFVYNYGEWSRDLAAQLWRDRRCSGSDPRYFQYAMLRRIAERSQALIVHNPAAANIVRSHSLAARLIEIPHLFSPPVLPAGWEVARLRQSMGFRPHTFVFGVFGYQRESKRVLPILRTFAELRAAGLDAGLVVAGEFVSRDLARAAEPLLRSPGVCRAGFAPEDTFWKLASAVDACLALRYPPAGETSGIAIRLMGIGKPVLITDSAESERLPETACVRVDAGPGETDSLAAQMMWLVRFPESAREIGRRARQYIGEKHSVERAAGSYWEALCAASCTMIVDSTKNGSEKH